MRYYPLSQITTGLVSKPGEFKLFKNTQTVSPEVRSRIINGEYVGPYVKTYDNKFFTGKSLTDDNGVFELLPLKKELIHGSEGEFGFSPNIKETHSDKQNRIINDIIDNNNTNSYYIHKYDYRKLTKKPYYSNAPLPPMSSLPKIGNEELIKGVISRYFCKHKVSKIIKEINETTFNKIQQKDNSIQYELYEIMKITWLLDDRKGDRYIYNKLQTNSAESLGFKGLKLFLNNEFDKIHF